eukprot:7268617-Pyramimonas_sp.AAC.1
MHFLFGILTCLPAELAAAGPTLPVTRSAGRAPRPPDAAMADCWGSCRWPGQGRRLSRLRSTT